MDTEEFIKPTEAPVFQPTHEEFKDPVAYLSKIRPVVINTGICKIKPPSGWRPPFSVNIEKFRFTPRLQPLNELDAKTRVKLNFLDNLNKFWDMQGVSMKIPTVGRSPLDLHKLYKVVTKNGGFEEICRNRKWTNIAREMQYDSINVSGSLRYHYEKILYPFEVFAVSNGQLKFENSDSGMESSAHHHHSVSPTKEKEITNDQQKLNDSTCAITAAEKLRRSRRKRMEDPDYAFELNEDSPEFKKLAFVSPGVKNSFAPLKRSTRRCVSKKEKDDSMEWDYGNTPSPTSIKSEPKDMSQDTESSTAQPSPITMKKLLVCDECGEDDQPESMVFCRGCSLVYHPFCLVPQMSTPPIGAWYCPACISKECCQPQEAFGFEQAKKEYCLRTYGQMANQFKMNYFNKQPTDVPFSTVEKEFWRLVRSIDDDVTVEYGADLHSSVHGSGFPMCMCEEEDSCCNGGCVQDNGEFQYTKSGWNLNNIPNLRGSVLRHIDANISGMKVPWLYVGMCFSCFCWHTEDHWSYSINYLHWGEPKTWYGVPPAYAEALEQTMKDQAPELFDNQPDLMHHLATIMSPTVLMKNGIPVVRTDQCAGEFVVTFPRAYHAGFNQGFNFAEAVNFSLADWVPVGRQCVRHYRDTVKPLVFSHDELVCKMVAQPHSLSLPLLLMAAKDATAMMQEEEQLRRKIQDMGVVNEERELFELAKDDEERLCKVCNTICFLSGIRCSCNPNLLYCPYHLEDSCSCPPIKKSFKYRHSINELHDLVSKAQMKANLFCVWSDKVDKLLDGFESPKPDIQFMKDLRVEAEGQSLTQCEQYQELCAMINEAERLQKDVYRMGRKDNVTTVSELKSLIDDLNSLPCVLQHTEAVKSRLNGIILYQTEVSTTLSSLASLSNSKEGTKVLRNLLERGEAMCVELTQMTELKNAINQVIWISETQEHLLNGQDIQMDWLRNTYKKGCLLATCPAVENVQNRVKGLLSMVQEWEQRTRGALKEKPPRPISFFETMLAKAQEIPVVIPLADTVTQTLQMAKQWTTKAQQMQTTDKDPHYDLLKELLSSSRSIPLRLDQLPQVESRYSAAKAWIDRAGRTFLKKNSSCSLIEVLLPRTLATCTLSKTSRIRKKQDDELSIVSTPLTPLIGDRMKEMVRIKEMERNEKSYLQSLRKTNSDKQREHDSKSRDLTTTSPVVYCLCRKPESGYMLQCEVCNEWYHAHCLHIPKSKLNQDTDISKDMRFICGGCLRSRRPRLDSIVSLLISLQKVPVAISEGTALHCLAERAISWQKKARELLGNIRGMVDAGRGQQLRLIDLRKKISKWKDEAVTTKSSQTEIQAQLASQADSVLRHYEAQLSKEKSAYLGMTESQRKKVEDLLLEGDLLEVTTDETTQIWQLLQTDSECSSYFALSEDEALKCDLPKLSQKKPTTVVCDEDEDDSSSGGFKKRKRVERSTTPSNRLPPPVPDSVGVSSPATKKKKPVKPVIDKKKKQPLTKSKASVAARPPIKSQKVTALTKSGDPLGCNEEIMDEEEDEGASEEEKTGDSLCSAGQCIKPTSSEVNWVQCDTCQLWYHLVCVGLTSESVQYIEAYHCFPCKQKRAKQTAASSTSSVTLTTSSHFPSSLPSSNPPPPIPSNTTTQP